jgi:hypothetical protein
MGSDAQGGSANSPRDPRHTAQDAVLQALGIAGLILVLCGWFLVPHWADVAVPAGFLMVIVAAGGKLGWVARPYFISGPPPRWIAWVLATLCLVWLVAGIVSHLDR